jgi:hypothetical protein
MLALVGAGPAAAEVTLEPAAGVAFGAVQIGLAADTEVDVVNEGTTSVTIDEAVLTGNSNFSIALDDCAGLTLDPDEFCVVVIRFAPNVAGVMGTQLSVPSDDPGSPDELFISGNGVAPRPSIPPIVRPTRPSRPVLPRIVLGVDRAALDFGSVVARKGRPVATVNVASSGGSVGRISAHLKGPDATSFAPRYGSCQVVSTASHCSVSVLFAPKHEGPHEATLIITGTNSNTVTVALHGVGVAAPVEKLPDRQVKRLLKGALTVPVGRWHDKSRRTILSAKGLRLNGPTIPGKGTLKLQVRTAGKGQRLVASGRLTYPWRTKPRTIAAGLTKAGKALLSEQSNRRLEAVLIFVAADGTRLAASRSFTLAD